MAQPDPFQIPEQMRELAERSVAQARTAYGQFMDAMLKAQGMWAMNVPSSPMTWGFKDVQDRAIKFARENTEAGLKAAEELARAKDVAEVLVIQSRFAQTQMQAFANQAHELGRLIIEAGQKMSKG